LGWRELEDRRWNEINRDALAATLLACDGDSPVADDPSSPIREITHPATM
jgi:hypothetical protein